MGTVTNCRLPATSQVGTVVIVVLWILGSNVVQLSVFSRKTKYLSSFLGAISSGLNHIFWNYVGQQNKAGSLSFWFSSFSFYSNVFLCLHLPPFLWSLVSLPFPGDPLFPLGHLLSTLVTFRISPFLPFLSFPFFSALAYVLKIPSSIYSFILNWLSKQSSFIAFTSSFIPLISAICLLSSWLLWDSSILCLMICTDLNVLLWGPLLCFR